ncbi:MAG: PAS domain S-box protein [Microcoleaceae cyanobacterium]
MKNIPVPPQESPDQMNDNWQIQNQQLQNLAHNVPGMLYQFRLDANGTPSFPYISSGCREVYGLEPEAVQQNPELILNQCVHSDDLSEVQRTIAESARTLEQWNCRWRIFDTQGQEKWLKGIASPRGCFDGSILWDGCVFDITEQKIIETQLQKSQDFLGLILDNIPQLIFWKDRNSVYQGCNQNFAQVAGVNSPEEIVGKTDFDLAWKQEEAEWFRQCDRKVMDSGEAELHIEEPQQQADGKQAWLDTNKIPLKDSDGNVMGILGTIEDITGRKQAEETLRILNHELEAHVSERTAALEKSLREISDIKSALDQAAMVSITDARGKILFINDKFCEVSQYSPSELIGQNQQIFSYSYTTTPHFKEMWRTIAKGNIWRGEIRYQRKDGSNCWIDTTVAPFMNERGKPYQYIVIGYDVSDRKQSELALLESNHQLQEKTCFLQSIWGGVDYGIYILDVINQGEDFRFVQFNPALIEASPIPVEQLLHKTVRETFPEEIAQIYLNRYRHCVQSSESSFFEEQLPVHGETKWWQLNINPLQNHAGEVQRLIVTSVDISERREAEIALQRLTQNLQEAQRIAHIGNWSYDRGTDTLNWSDEVFRIFGLPLEAETPDIMQWASYFHPTDAELLQQDLNQKYVNQGQSQLE